MGAREAGELVRQYLERSGVGQVAVAHMLSERLGHTIRQGQVSAHVNGRSWGKDPGQLARAYMEVLGITEEEMLQAWGFGTKPGPRPVTLADVIKADPTLSPAAKKHLLSQYGLLQLASQQERKGKPVLPAEKKSRRSS